MISRREVCGGLVTAAVAPSLVGCGGSKRSMSVVLDWLFNVNHAALFAALHTGAFARHGLDVDLIAPSDPDSPARLVAAGHADLAVGYGSQINMLSDKGLPLVRVGTLVDRPVNAVMALGGSGIRTVSDLKGRKIGISVGGVEEAMVDAMLRSAGLAPSQVTFVRVNYELVTALLTRRIDAGIGAFRNDEVLEVQAKDGPPTVLAPEDNGVPLYDELILIARRDRIADPRTASFLLALREGTAALLREPDSLWRAFVTAHPEQNTKVIKAAWAMTLGWLAHDPITLDRSRYLKFQAFCLAQGIIAKLAPLETFAVQIAV
ncbi:MAG: ABC transporter substrate-binding protein [Caulobacteraceae bacterium]